MLSAPGPIYLDCAATTAVDPRVAELALRLMKEEFGNAGSRTHVFGAVAAREVALARERIGAALDADPDEVVFTGGATESDNLAILGLAAWGNAQGRRHFVSTAIEHHAVLEPLARLAASGFEVTLVRPNRLGRVAAEEVLAAVRPDTLLVSVMHANNETGALQPIGAIANGLAEEGPFLHVDAAQTLGREGAALRDRRIDLVSLSGHKTFAPKGIGALVARRRQGKRVPLEALMVGGGQERGLRPGTLAVPLIAGFGLAAELAGREYAARRKACASVRAAALAAFDGLEGVVVHGQPGHVLLNILSVSIPGVDSEAAMVALKPLVAISNGSACTSARYEPSHVLKAMGLEDEVVSGTIRFSWSHDTPNVDWAHVAATLDDLRI